MHVVVTPRGLRPAVIGDLSDGADFQINTDALVNAGVQAAQSNPTLARAAAVGGAVLGGFAAGAEIGVLIPIPGIGIAVGAVIGAIVGLASSLGPILAQAIHGQCTITIVAGQDVDCRDYAAAVQEAARWVHANPSIAATMTPEALSVQTRVLEQDFADWASTIDKDYLDRIQSSGALDANRKLPGTRTLLRAVQLPLAAGVAAASPEVIALFRADYGGTFPALTPADADKIVAAVKPILESRIADAIAWSNAQTRKPTYDEIHARYPAFVPTDVQRIADVPLTREQEKTILSGGVQLVDARVLAFIPFVQQTPDDQRWKNPNYIQFCRDYVGRPVNAATARCADDLHKANFAVLAGGGVTLHAGSPAPPVGSAEPTPQAKRSAWAGVAAALGSLGVAGSLGFYLWKVRG